MIDTFLKKATILDLHIKSDIDHPEYHDFDPYAIHDTLKKCKAYVANNSPKPRKQKHGASAEDCVFW